jgi:DNA-directed RNA polymerase subunit RPC12/RpoP
MPLLRDYLRRRRSRSKSREVNMTYVCMECGAEVEYDELLGNKLQCTKCREKRSNIWMKRRSDKILKTIKAR